MTILLQGVEQNLKMRPDTGLKKSVADTLGIRNAQLDKAVQMDSRPREAMGIA